MPFEFSSKNCLLFDLDGTLVDSSPIHAEAFVWALRPHHPGIAARFDYQRFLGRPTQEVFQTLGILDPGEAGALARAKQERYRAAVERGEVRLFEGAFRTLAALSEAGRRLFVVTGASRLSATRVLQANRIDGLFEGVTAAEDAKPGKPAPTPFLVTLERHGLETSRCLAVEDAESGIVAACAAGIDAALVNTPNCLPGVPNLGAIGQLSERLLA